MTDTADRLALADKIERSSGLSLNEYDAFKGHHEEIMSDDKVRLIVMALRGESVQKLRSGLAEELYNRIAPQRFSDENLVPKELGERIVAALRAPQREAQDEPVAWLSITEKDGEEITNLVDRTDVGAFPVYAHPPASQGREPHEDRISFSRWWIERIRDDLKSIGKMPSGPLGDWAFLFREQLNDALDRTSTSSTLSRPVLQPQMREALELPVQSWEVEVRINGVNALTIGQNYLAGAPNIDQFSDVIENCARHLMAFIDGRETFTGPIEQALEKIPESVEWLIGRGKTRPDEPLYGIQLRKAGTDTILAEAEHDDLPTAIEMAIRGLPT